ncbi:MAG: spore cortex biosynthesis protein YabQ [Oscillospiraceae bacterium]|jgi:hypothetical protein|nr:spore cortex biosynthesis protein YabQ [Oscillospiraceae bacterium]
MTDVSATYMLRMLSYFAVVGFGLGVLYEPLRIIRMFKAQGALFVGIQDFLFALFAGLVTFLYVMEFAGGVFRPYFAAAEFVGGAVYFLTVGQLVSACSRLIVSTVKWVARFIYRIVAFPIKLLLMFLGKQWRKLSARRNKRRQIQLEAKEKQKAAEQAQAAALPQATPKDLRPVIRAVISR